MRMWGARVKGVGFWFIIGLLVNGILRQLITMQEKKSSQAVETIIVPNSGAELEEEKDTISFSERYALSGFL